MTWIYGLDGSVSWVVYPPRKRRKSPRAVRFADIKVGDQLVRYYPVKECRTNADGERVVVTVSQQTWHYLVTDLWFDPVAGQDNHVAGEKVAIAQIKSDGQVLQRKEPHTKRGLASQGFHYAGRDFIALARQRLDAENVVGIGLGAVIRARPKVPGARF